MKHPVTPIRCLWITTALLIAGCAKEPALTVADAPAEPPKPAIIKFTSGRIDMSALDVTDLTQVEVIAISETTPELEILLSKQHRLYVAALKTPTEAGTTPTEGLDLLDEKDVEAMTQSLDKLKAGYPPRLESSYTIDTRSQEFVSRESLHKRYAGDIAAINLQNMVPAITAIAEKLRSDHALLLQDEIDYAETNRGYQAMADINWLSQFVDYMEQYKGVMARYDTLRSRALEKQLRAEQKGELPLNPQSAFAKFQHENAMLLQINVYKMSQGTTAPAADGSFKVEGQGDLLVRINDEDVGEIFFSPNMSRPTVKILDLELSTLTVMPQ